MGQEMTRMLTSRKLAGLNDALQIKVLDEPGQGNACHEYSILIPNATFEYEMLQHISFQNGPLKETIPNGVSNEALLAIVEDRLIGFQSGEFACRENALALTEAMMWLHKRTRDRLARGVEGTNQK